MAIAEITLKSILLGSLQTFDSGNGLTDEVREQLSEHLAAGLAARNAVADGMYGRYYFGWYCIGEWDLDTLRKRYDVDSLTDADMMVLKLEMSDTFHFGDIDDEVDCALRKAARNLKLPRLESAPEDEEDEDDEDFDYGDDED